MVGKTGSDFITPQNQVPRSAQQRAGSDHNNLSYSQRQFHQRNLCRKCSTRQKLPKKQPLNDSDETHCPPFTSPLQKLSQPCCQLLSNQTVAELFCEPHVVNRRDHISCQIYMQYRDELCTHTHTSQLWLPTVTNSSVTEDSKGERKLNRRRGREEIVAVFFFVFSCRATAPWRLHSAATSLFCFRLIIKPNY